MGGEIRLEGERSLRAHCPGSFINALLWAAVLFFSLGALTVLVVVVIAEGSLETAPAMLPSVLFVGWFGFLLRVRRRRMGTFVVDAARGTLVHLRGATELERWPLQQVRFETVLDPFHRGWGLHHWLVARVPDGRGLRLGKGPKEELARPLSTLASWGLTVVAL